MVRLDYVIATLEGTYGLEVVKTEGKYQIFTRGRKRVLATPMTAKELKAWYLGFRAREKVRKKR